MFYRNVDQLERIQKNIEKIYVSDRWSNGQFTEEFEALLKEKEIVCPGYKVLPCANGTIALSIAIAASVGSKTILLPELTATPVWFGTEYVSHNGYMEKEYYSVENRWRPDLNKITEICRKDYAFGDRSIVVVVHTGGIVCDNIADIRAICDKYNAMLIEDVSHAQGCSVKFNGMVKAGWFGDIIVGSMYATKTITSGEGGFIAFNEKEVDVYSYWNSGRNNTEKQSLGVSVGFNGRASEFQAAIMCEVIRDFEKIVEWRTWHAKRFDSLIIPEIVPVRDTGAISSYYKYILYVSQGDAGKIDRLKEMLKVFEINATTGLVHSVYYNGCDNLWGTESLSHRHLCLNIFHLKYEQIAEKINYVFE